MSPCDSKLTPFSDKGDVSLSVASGARSGPSITPPPIFASNIHRLPPQNTHVLVFVFPETTPAWFFSPFFPKQLQRFFVAKPRTQLFSGTHFPPFFWLAAPLKWFSPKRVPFFSRVTEQLREGTSKTRRAQPGLVGGAFARKLRTAMPGAIDGLGLGLAALKAPGEGEVVILQPKTKIASSSFAFFFCVWTISMELKGTPPPISETHAHCKVGPGSLCNLPWVGGLLAVFV